MDLLDSAARDGALVVADGEDDLRRATAAGVGRLGLRVETGAVGHGPSQYGVPDAKVTAVHRDAAARGLRNWRRSPSTCLSRACDRVRSRR